MRKKLASFFIKFSSIQSSNIKWQVLHAKSISPWHVVYMYWHVPNYWSKLIDPKYLKSTHEIVLQFSLIDNYFSGRASHDCCRWHKIKELCISIPLVFHSDTLLMLLLMAIELSRQTAAKKVKKVQCENTFVYIDLQKWRKIWQFQFAYCIKTIKNMLLYLNECKS